MLLRIYPGIIPSDLDSNAKNAYPIYTIIDIDKLRKSRDWVLNALYAGDTGSIVLREQ
jgi:hypothetical protein